MSGPSYDGKQSLAERFRKLIGRGMSPSEAVVLLSELYYAFHFCIVQPLPGGRLLFELGAAGELIVKLDGRRLDPERILTREPNSLDPPPINLATYRAICADPRQAERDALAELTIDAPPVPHDPPISAPRPAPALHTQNNKRGRRPYDVWQPMFEHLSKLAKKRGKPFESYAEAAGYGRDFIAQQLTAERRKKGKGTAVPALQTIAEKISETRPDLAVGIG